MSRNMSNRTSSSAHGHGETGQMGGGMIIQKKCIICNVEHTVRPKAKCSEDRQKHYAEIAAREEYELREAI